MLYWRCKLTIVITLYYRQGNKWQMITKSCLQNGNEPTVFGAEVAKHHDAFADMITFGVFEALG